MQRVSEAVVDTLVSNDIEFIFGIPGTQSLPLNEAVEAEDRLRFVMARHETAVSHQAWGHAEVGGGMAATVVIPGPGDMNAMNGLKNALNDCTPLLHIAVETDPDLRGGDAIHETPPETYDSVVKENLTVARAEQTVAALDRAIAVAMTPPRGPVRVGIPRGFLGERVELTASATHPSDGPEGVPSAELRRAVRVLTGADRPVVVAGGGVRASGATEELLAVAERLDAPVVPTYKGKGVFPEDHPLFAGIMCVGSSEHLHRCVREADAALAVGTDLDAVTTQAWSFDLPASLVHVTLEADDVGRGYPAEVAIAADARETLRTLLDRLGEPDGDEREDAGAGGARAGRVREGDAALMADVLAVESPPLTSASAEAALDAALPDDAMIALDAGGFRIWALHVLEARGKRAFVDTGSWASMGTSLPAAIGAQLAWPERPAVALVGGGGLLMCMQELHTIATEEVPVLVVVLNNADYATISAEAAAGFAFDDGAFGWPSNPISFAAIAEAMGVDAVRAETPAAVRDAVGAALERRTPTLVEIPTDPDEPQAKPLR